MLIQVWQCCLLMRWKRVCTTCHFAAIVQNCSTTPGRIVIKFNIYKRVDLESGLELVKYVWLHKPCPWAPEPTAFLSATTFSGNQTGACAHALEFRSTSLRRRTIRVYDAPIAGSSLTMVSYELAINCCALCTAVEVTAVVCMQWVVIFLECKVLMSTIKSLKKFVTCPQVQASWPVCIYNAPGAAACVCIDVNLWWGMM